MTNSSLLAAAHGAVAQSGDWKSQAMTHMMSFASSGSDDHSESHVHAHVAVLFLFVTLLLGAVTTIFLSRCLPSLPYTVVMLMEGFFIGFLEEHTRSHLGLFSDSLRIWSSMDPHLLLFAFLPALLFADSMNLNWHMWKKCLGQCLILAGPGVLFGTAATAAFAYYVFPYDWTWEKALMFGSILSATDPVAVVGILKELGASPKLTMAVSGESLLNDGTAIVMFNLFCALSIGTKEALQDTFGSHVITAGVIFKYFLWMAFGGAIFGAVLGLIAVVTVGNFKRKTVHTDSIVQITVTLVLAYLTFFFGEEVAGVSGVLATVSCALVFAACGWPHFVDRQTMESVWHMIEFVLNTVIFTLAGVIIGDSFGEDMRHFHHLGWEDIGYLCILYVALLAIRGVMVLVFYPCISRMGYSLDWRDAFMLTWGGLRGALGLALALDVNMRFQGISQEDSIMGSRMLFHVGGFAMLTLLINGVTSSYFLRVLGMAGSSKYHEALHAHVEFRIQEKCEKVLDAQAAEFLISGEDVKTYREKVLKRVHALQHVKTVISQANVRKGGDFPEPTRQCTPQGDSSSYATTGENRCSALRELFLQMLRSKYMEFIENGILESQGQVSIILMNSVDDAMNKATEKLGDWEAVQKGCNTGTILNKIWDCAERRLPEFFLVRDIFENAGLAIREHTVCYLVLCFVHAHTLTQENIEILLRADRHSPEAPVLTKIIQESKDEVKAAWNAISELDPELVEEVKVDAITNTVLDGERRFIMDLVEEGALQEKQAHHLLEGITADLIANAKRKAARPSYIVNCSDGIARGLSHKSNNRLDEIPSAQPDLELTGSQMKLAMLSGKK